MINCKQKKWQLCSLILVCMASLVSARFVKSSRKSIGSLFATICLYTLEWSRLPVHWLFGRCHGQVWVYIALVSSCRTEWRVVCVTGCDFWFKSQGFEILLFIVIYRNARVDRPTKDGLFYWCGIFLLQAVPVNDGFNLYERMQKSSHHFPEPLLTYYIYVCIMHRLFCTVLEYVLIWGLLLKPKHTPKPHAKYRGLYLGVWAYNLIAGPLAQSSSFCIFGNRMTKSPAEFKVVVH